MNKIEVSDVTLKELQSPDGRTLSLKDRAAIARSVRSVGADAIELPALCGTREDEVVCRTIASVADGCTVAVPAGITEDSIKAASSAIGAAKKPRLQIELPSSTVQMEYIYHVKAPKMLEMAAGLVSCAKNYCGDVEFIALDASRAERDFLRELCAAAVSSGATVVTLSDDAGIMTPDETAELIKYIRGAVNAKLYFAPNDALGLAAACAISAANAGADGVKTVLTGSKSLSAGLFADIVRAKGEALGIDCGLIVSGVHNSIEEIVSALDNKSSDTPAAADVPVQLTVHSTLSEVSQAVSALGYELGDADCGKVYEEAKRVMSRKGSIGAKELEAVIASAAMQVPSTYHIESYVINSGNIITATANIVLNKDGEKLTGISTGDGPINAAFLAIEQIIGHHYELDDFQIQAVTEGHEAVGSAVVKLREGGVLYSGNGISTDIVGASIRAYINALNKIVYKS